MLSVDANCGKRTMCSVHDPSPVRKVSKKELSPGPIRRLSVIPKFLFSARSDKEENERSTFRRLSLTMLFSHAASPLSDSMTSLKATSGRCAAIDLSHVILLVFCCCLLRNRVMEKNKEGEKHIRPRNTQQCHVRLKRGSMGSGVIAIKGS